MLCLRVKLGSWCIEIRPVSRSNPHGASVKEKSGRSGKGNSKVVLYPSALGLSGFIISSSNTMKRSRDARATSITIIILSP